MLSLAAQFHKSLSIVLVAPAQNQAIDEPAMCLPKTKIPYLESINYLEQCAKKVIKCHCHLLHRRLRLGDF